MRTWPHCNRALPSMRRCLLYHSYGHELWTIYLAPSRLQHTAQGLDFARLETVKGCVTALNQACRRLC